MDNTATIPQIRFCKHLTRITFTVFLSLLVLTGCSENFSSSVGKFANQLGGLFAIKELVDQQLTGGESAIHIQNGRTITISLVNTAYNEDTFENRKSLAIKTAQLVSDHINDKPEYKSVQNIVITYVHHEKKFLIVDYTQTFDVFPFEVSDLKQGAMTQGIKI
jgi:hypothetical protein